MLANIHWNVGKSEYTHILGVIKSRPNGRIEEHGQLADSHSTLSSLRGRCAPLDIFEHSLFIRLRNHRCSMRIIPGPFLRKVNVSVVKSSQSSNSRGWCSSSPDHHSGPKRTHQLMNRTGQVARTSYACCSAANRCVAFSWSSMFLSGWCFSARRRKERCHSQIM